MPWALRVGVAACMLAMLALAVAAQQPAAQPLPEAVSTLAPTAGAVVPTVTLTPAPPRPTATPETVISRLARETLAPYPTSTPTPVGVATVSVVDFGYMPQIERISIGQTVTWRNDGQESHDVTGNDWHSGPIDYGTTYRHTFGFAGTYQYRCSIHPDMLGTVIVTG